MRAPFLRRPRAPGRAGSAPGAARRPRAPRTRRRTPTRRARGTASASGISRIGKPSCRSSGSEPRRSSLSSCVRVRRSDAGLLVVAIDAERLRRAGGCAGACGGRSAAPRARRRGPRARCARSRARPGPPAGSRRCGRSPRRRCSPASSTATCAPCSAQRVGERDAGDAAADDDDVDFDVGVERRERRAWASAHHRGEGGYGSVAHGRMMHSALRARQDAARGRAAPARVDTRARRGLNRRRSSPHWTIAARRGNRLERIGHRALPAAA